jgi:hypothetical protein
MLYVVTSSANLILSIISPNNTTRMPVDLLSTAGILDVGPCKPVYCDCNCKPPPDVCWFAIAAINCSLNYQASVIITTGYGSYQTLIPIIHADVMPFIATATSMELHIDANFIAQYVVYIVICVVVTIMVVLIYSYMLSQRQQKNEHVPLISKEYIYYATNTPCENETHRLCTICISDYVDGAKLKELLCHHRYHADCITPWLNNGKKCPVCRGG